MQSCYVATQGKSPEAVFLTFVGLSIIWFTLEVPVMVGQLYPEPTNMKGKRKMSQYGKRRVSNRKKIGYRDKSAKIIKRQRRKGRKRIGQ